MLVVRVISHSGLLGLECRRHSGVVPDDRRGSGGGVSRSPAAGQEALVRCRPVRGANYSQRGSALHLLTRYQHPVRVRERTVPAMLPSEVTK